MRHFAQEDKLSRGEEMLSTELDQETVLMSVDAGAYYGLEGTARSIWESLEQPLTFAELVARMVQEYEVPLETCSADLQPFLANLEREGLLRVE
jgi:Coenzyme PQQ synthesis protein D (PqqD)